jgi:sugar fermentation stimulation protein A
MTGILQPHFAGEITREYRFEDSRFDFAIQGKDVLTVLEVKSVTLGPEGPEPGMGYFPDAVSTRARKHVEALVRARSQGLNAVLLYCVQHTGIRRVAPAVHIDPVYGELLQSAHRAGVRILAVSCDLSPRTWRVSAFIPVDLPSD